MPAKPAALTPDLSPPHTHTHMLTAGSPDAAHLRRVVRQYYARDALMYHYMMRGNSGDDLYKIYRCLSDDVCLLLESLHTGCHSVPTSSMRAL